MLSFSHLISVESGKDLEDCLPASPSIKWLWWQVRWHFFIKIPAHNTVTSWDRLSFTHFPSSLGRETSCHIILKWSHSVTHWREMPKALGQK